MRAEVDAFTGEPVEVRGQRLAVAVAAHDAGGVVVGDEEQQVRRAGGEPAADERRGGAGAELSAREHDAIVRPGNC